MGHSPNYRILDEKGPDHAKAFFIAVELDGKQHEPCWGKSKKSAEQKAALNALRELGLTVERANGQTRMKAEASMISIPEGFDEEGFGDDAFDDDDE